MKTLICSAPGHLEYRDCERPLPARGRTILRIRRIGVCGTDLHAYEGTQPFFNYPRVLGHELAAAIEETDEPGFEAGEAVTLVPYFNCGHCVACRTGKPNCCVRLEVCGVHVNGGMTEYLSVPSGSLLSAPGLDLDEMALVEPLAIGAHAVRRASVVPGEWVLVMGAGPIGLGVMEFSRMAGARVIAMDVNRERLGFCIEKLNIEQTLDPFSLDPVEYLMKITGADMPSVVFDATGSLPAINNGFGYLAHGGRYVLVGLQKGSICFSHPEFHKKEATLISSRNATHGDFIHVINCIRNKSINPVTYITHRVGFREAGEHFRNWLDPASKVIKAMIEV
jgi:2-desacetyl-2-hydroxyethyl bacteriochlorophyllide A dehydrogenase